MTTTTAIELLTRMEELHAQCDLEGRAFNAAEARQWAAWKSDLLAKEATVEDQLLDQPTHPTRPIAAAVRSLSAAALADGLVARLMQAGRARVDVPIDIRAFGSDAALNPAPGIHVQPSNLGLVSTQHYIVNRLLSALASISIEGTNAVVYTRVRYSQDVGSPSTGAGNRGAVVQELALKPQSELDTEEITQPIDTFAHWLPCSKQVLDDMTGLRVLLDTTLVNGLLDKTDAIVFAALTLANRFTPYVPVANDKIGDGIARAATALLTAGATGVKVALNPSTILAMSIAKTSGSGEYQGMPANVPGTIVSSASVPAGKLLAWSDSGAIWASRQGISVVAGLQGDQFVRNAITLLAEHRGAVLTLDPAHILYGNAVA